MNKNKIRPGEIIKCFLNNGMAIEGELIDWSDDMVQIKTSTDSTISIIYKPAENIFLVKILILQDSKEKPEPDIANQVEERSPPEVGLSNYGFPGFLASKVAK